MSASVASPASRPTGALPLSYLEAGESIGGEPLIIMHGLFGSARNWHVLSKRFGEQRRVFALDMRNHGGSPWAPTMTYRDMAADVVRFLDDRGFARAALLGHSMGGKTAMTVALTAPERVSRLIVTDIAPVKYTHTHAPYVRAMKEARLDGMTRRSEVDAQLVEAVPTPSLRSFLMQNLVMDSGRFVWRLNLEALAGAMDEVIDFPELAGARYLGPTLFLGGTASDYITEQERPAIAEHFPNATVTMIEDAGHWLHAERTQAFAEAVEAFL